MGGELWMWASKGEAKRLAALLEQIQKDNGTSFDGVSHCWLERKGTSRKFVIGYTADADQRAYAMALGIKIAERVNLDKHGWDHAGWSEDGVALKDREGPYAYQILCAKQALEAGGLRNFILDAVRTLLRDKKINLTSYKRNLQEVLADLEASRDKMLASAEKAVGGAAAKIEGNFV